MKELYDLLDKLLELNDLSEICNLITSNYNLFSYLYFFTILLNFNYSTCKLITF